MTQLKSAGCRSIYINSSFVTSKSYPNDFSDIDYLAEICIKVRIAAKLSCEELGELSGISAEKIREYEEKDYENASFLDVKAVIDALNIKVKTGEFLVALDTLRRTPITKEELLQTKSTELR
ncbi:MAG: hypothetical protein SAL07_13045 [Oscillatoria sp. PMC 1051.18]|nr:hypothetical protein [Oscillatoria sp. PMC 1050.18]MEC5030818.1 hypothetical protein [Oscillatoria sp. PMC 1051.18]